VNGRAGFTLIESLVAASILLSVAAGLYAAVGPAHLSSRGHPAAVDMQQRVRTAAEAITADLLAAGCGPVNGVFGAPLGALVPSILPYRIGERADVPGTIRPDAITVLSASAGGVAATLRDPFAPSDGLATIDLVPGCPAGDPSCGLRADDTVLAVDAHGQSDLFRVVEPAGQVILLEALGPTSGRPFPAGSALVPVAVRVYALRAGSAAEGVQLVRGGADHADMPQVDHVSRLGFEYLGDAGPPQLRQAPSPGEPSTTYGPAPPAPGVDDGRDSWPAGENCTFQATGGIQATRLAALGGDGWIVRLPPGLLVDGPWCPDAAVPNRHDADLLRVRAVRVTIRVEAAQGWLRGRDARLFARPGSSRGGSAFVPDQQVVFDVVPRCLGGGR